MVPGMILVALLLILISAPASAQSDQYQRFVARCAECHGTDARGTAKGPGLAMNPRVAVQTVDDLADYLRRGNPAAGMPSFGDLDADERLVLARYLRRINVETIIPPPAAVPDRPITFGPPQPGDWRTYNGDDSGNRYSRHALINTSTIDALRLQWVFPMSYAGLEVTPLAADGVVYVTGPNQVVALDASSGAALWNYSRPPTPGLVGDSRLGTNRGVALRGDQVFFVTDNAHLLALDRGTGNLRWETVMTPPPEPDVEHRYGGTIAPLVVRDMVLVGVSGADAGIRGFVAAFNADTGALVWRRWTVPRAGEPGIETWQGPEPLRGGGSTWSTGSYDAESDTVYWATGNPWPGGEDRDRPGDNLYTNCVLALDAASGRIKWYYQFTPHDVEDRDATEPNVLVDRLYRGRPSRLLLHADRNGFFYVLDRTSGEVLLAKPFLRRVDWASGIGADGRPVVVDPHGCPTDAANWDSTAYSPDTGLYYVLALEECVGKPTGYPEQTGQRFLRALDVETGDIVWEVPQPGPARAKTWSGVLATAGGLLFYGQPNGGFVAADQKSGRTLWQFPTNARMKASPMTFVRDGRQYIVVAAGPNILCFGLGPAPR
jgi:alcohol dehydrogenase (cytochrome c)